MYYGLPTQLSENGDIITLKGACYNQKSGDWTDRRLWKSLGDNGSKRKGLPVKDVIVTKPITVRNNLKLDNIKTINGGELRINFDPNFGGNKIIDCRSFSGRIRLPSDFNGDLTFIQCDVDLDLIVNQNGGIQSVTLSGCTIQKINIIRLGSTPVDLWGVRNMYIVKKILSFGRIDIRDTTFSGCKLSAASVTLMGDIRFIQSSEATIYTESIGEFRVYSDASSSIDFRGWAYRSASFNLHSFIFDGRVYLTRDIEWVDTVQTGTKVDVLRFNGPLEMNGYTITVEAQQRYIMYVTDTAPGEGIINVVAGRVIVQGQTDIEFQLTGAGRVDYIFAGVQQVSRGQYYDLNLSGGGTKKLMGDVTVANSYTLAPDTIIDLNGYTLTTP